MNRFVFKKALQDKSLQEAILFLVLALALLGYSLTGQYGGGAPQWKLSPYLFPALVGLLLLLPALSLLGEALQRRKSPKATSAEGAAAPENSIPSPNAAPVDLRRVWVVLGATVLYLLLLPVLTFLPATVLLLGGLFTFLGERRLWVTALLSVGTAVGCYVVFELLLRVMLP